MLDMTAFAPLLSMGQNEMRRGGDNHAITIAFKGSVTEKCICDDYMFVRQQFIIWKIYFSTYVSFEAHFPSDSDA